MRLGVSVRAEFRRALAAAVRRTVELVLRPGADRMARRSFVEPLESRQYLTAVTLTGPGTGGTAFLASLNSSTGNIDFSVSGTVVQSMAAATVSSVVVDDAGSGDTLTVNAAGTSFSVDGSGTSALTLVVDQGAVTLSATQSLDNVEVSAGSSLTLAGNVTLNGLTVDGAATHASGTLTANILNVDNSYTDAGGTTASGITINNTGTFIAAYAGSLAGITGTFSNSGTFVENVASGSSISTGITFNNTAGTIDLAGAGTLSLSNSLSVPNGSTLTIEGTGTLAMAVLDDVDAAITQQGGTLDLTGNLDVGDGQPDAVYTLDGGTIDTPELYIGGYPSFIAAATTGSFVQNGGVVNASYEVKVGDGYANTAHYTMTAGSINTDQVEVGDASAGTFTQSGGTINAAASLYIGIIGDGTVTQTGGTGSYGNVLVGPWNGTGSYTLSGGSVTDSGQLSVGENGVGTFNLSGTGSLNVGVEYIGSEGTGTFHQDGGSNACTSNIWVGVSGGDAGTTSDGTYLLAGGSLSASTEFLGDDSVSGAAGAQSQTTGTLTQSGGVNTVTGLAIATQENAAGTYNLVGGTLNDCQFVDGYLNAGAAVATFNQSGGQSYFTQWIMVGDQATGILDLSGGTMSLTGTFYDGYGTTGTVNLSGGSLAVTGNLYVTGDGNNTDPAGAGTLNLSGTASLSTADTFVGYSGAATLNQSGGTLAVSSYLVLDGPGGTIGTVNYTGGTAPTATQTINVLKPTAGGASVVNEGSSYTLNLSATTNVGANAIDAWNIVWGDSTANTSLSGSPPASSATHTYVTGGHTYTINATASGGGDSFASPAQSVVVNDVPATVAPVSTSSAPLTVNAGSLLSFSTTWSDPGSNETHTASINWGDGSVTPMTGPPTPGSVTLSQSGNNGSVSASHVYEQNGTYTALLSITDSGGAVSQTPIYITVNYVAPTLKIIAPLDPVYTNQSFTLQLHDDGPNPTGVTGWVVNWGDGTSTTLSGANNNNQPSSGTPTEAEWDLPHTYAAAGNYTVTATATDSSGTLPAVTASVPVAAPAPLVTIGGPATATRYSPYTLNLSAVYPATDSAPAAVSSWTIHWGDGTTQTLTGNPTTATHLYTEAQGPFAITATATDGNGTYAAKSLAIDPSFGNGTGAPGTSDVDAGSTADSAYASAVDSQGRIVVAGVSGTTIMRFLPNGTLDTTFGTGGKVSIAGMDWAYGVAIGPNNSIYVGGGDGFDLAKLTSTGALDTTFGTGGTGKITNVLNPSYYDAYDLTVQPDGKILLAGNGSYDFAFARFNPNGTLDTTFGTGGTLVSDIGSPADHAFAVTEQPDGKILAAGYYKMSSGYYEMAVARYSSFGVLDPTFGTGGVALKSIGSSNSEALALAVQPNGDIVLAGSSLSTGTNTTARDFALARFTPAGVLDTTFGTNGIVTTDFGYGDDQAYAVAILPGGDILATGHATGADGKDFGLARYTSSGVLDPTFGMNGLLTTKFAPNTSDAAETITFDAAGNLIVAGAANGDFGLAYYDVNSSLAVSVIQPIVSPLVVSSTPVAGASVTVSATVLPPETNSTDTLSYSWSLVDPANPSHPTVMTTATPSVTFTPPDAGEWSVMLTVTDTTTAGSATSATTFAVAVPQPLTVTGPSLIDLNGTANYFATDSAPSTVAWTATFQGATVASGSGATFAFTPSTAGLYTVTALDNAGATQVTQLTATAVAPDVTIIGASSGFVGSALTFSSTLGNSTYQSGSVDYTWSLLNGAGVPQALSQNGNPSSYPSTNSSFTVPGTLAQGSYQAKVVVTDPSGDTAPASATFGFTVLANPSTPDFDWGSMPIAGLNDNSRLVPEAVVQEPDGKFLVAGHLSDDDSDLDSPSYIARFNADLTLDTSFGPTHTGVLVANLDTAARSGFSGYTDILAIAVSNDGQDLIVTGSVENELGSGNPFPTLVVAEYTLQSEIRNNQMVLPGVLDPQFNNGQPFVEGSTTTSSTGTAIHVSPAPDGSILIGGIAETPFSSASRPDPNTPEAHDFLLMKFQSNGSLDTSFNSNGVAQQTNLSGYPSFAPFYTSSPIESFDQIADSVTSIDVVNGKILLGGYFDRPETNGDGGSDIGFALAEYNSDGTLNTSFGDNDSGHTFTSSSIYVGDTEGEALLSAMTVLSDGDILAAGIAANDSQDRGGLANIVTAEYTPAGALDLSYGDDNGITDSHTLVDAPESALTPLGGDGNAENDDHHDGEIPDNASMVFQADGKLVVSAFTDNEDSIDPTAWKLERLNIDGSIDTTFGDNGTGIETVPSPSWPQGSAWSFFPAQRSTAITLNSEGGVVCLGTMFGYPNGASANAAEIPLIVQYRTQPAPAVANVTASAALSGAVDLAWSNAGYGENGFEILRSTSAAGLTSSAAIIATVGANQDTYVDPNLTADTEYFYKVVPLYTAAAGSNAVGSAPAALSVLTPPTVAGMRVQQSLEVPLNGQSVSATSLQSGQTYIVVASGQFHLTSGFTADAADWYSASDRKTLGTQFAGTNYGLGVADGTAPTFIPDWGSAYSATPHQYEWAFVSDGLPLSFNYQAALYPSGSTNSTYGNVPLLVEIYAMPRAAVTPPTPPVTPSGAPTLSLSVPAADGGATPPVLSVAASVDISVIPVDSTPVPWVLDLVSATGSVQQLSYGTATLGSESFVATVDPSALANDGVYTLQLSTNVVTPEVNNQVTESIALEKPVAVIMNPAPTPLGIPPVISTNIPIDVLAACPDGTSTPWKLLLIDAANNQTLLASGNSSIGSLPATSANVFTLDPALYPNGAYTLQLVTNLGGGQTPVVYNRAIAIATATKAGNLTLPVTDAAVAAAGGSIDISRAYDSSRLDRISHGIPGFGPGWTFSLLDTRLSVTAQADTFDPTQFTPAFRAGDLVSLTTPDGSLHVFEFDPVPLATSQFFAGNVTGALYTPRFVALDGSGATLTLPMMATQAVTLAYDPADNEYLCVDMAPQGSVVWTNDDPTDGSNGAAADLAFNPARSYFGNQYQLTLASGASYIINATTGEIESSTDQNGNAVTYTTSSNQIVATDKSQRVLFTISTSGGLVTSIQVPGENAIAYSYVGGSLTSVSNGSGQSTVYTYRSGAGAQPLTGVVNAQGETLLQAGYDAATGDLVSLTNSLGKTVPVTTTILGADDVVQTVVDAAGNVSEDVFDERLGTLSRQVRYVTDAAGNVPDYIVSTTSFTYVTDDVGYMSAVQPFGVQILQSVQTYATFDVPAKNGQGADQSQLRFSQSPAAGAWTKQVIFDTSNRPEDTANGQIVSSSQRIADGGVLMTTLYGSYAVVDAALQTVKPQVTTVELQTPDSASATGYDDQVQSTTYVGYDASGNEIYSVTPVGRAGVPGGGDAATLAGGYPQYLYVNLSGVTGGSLATLVWNGSLGGYQWTVSWTTPTAGTATMTLLDTSLSAGRTTPVLGDAWSVSISDGGNNGFAGSLAGQSFDGTVNGLSTLVTAFFGKSIFTNNSSTQTYTAGHFGVGGSVPGWIAVGTQNTLTPAGGSTAAGMVASSQSVTAIILPGGTVGTITPYATTATNTYYGTGDYAYNTTDNAWEPITPGVSYGQMKTSVDAAGQETYYGYDASGRTVLQYTFKSWTNGAGVIVYGWVGTTSVYDSAGRLTDTYTATYAVGGYTPGTAIPSLPIVTGGPAGIQIDTSVDPLYLGIQPLRTQHIDYNGLGQQAETVDQYGGTTTNTYDANGNTIETVNPDGTETLTVYDALNRAIWSTNSFDPSNLATAITTRTVYNQLGQVIETQQYAGELIMLGTVTLGSAQLPTTSVTTVDGTPGGLPVLGSGQSLISSTFTYYDAAGNAIETIGANGLRTGTIYNPDGSVEYTGPLNSGAPDGGREVTTYAGVSSKAFSLSDFLVNSSNGYTTTLANQYDPSLGLFYSETIDQLGHVTKTYTDTLGRTVRTVYDDGSFTETLYGVGSSSVAQDQEGDAIPTPTSWVNMQSGDSETVNLAQRKLGDPIVATYDVDDAAGRLTDVYQPEVIDGDSTSPTHNQLVNPHWSYGYDTAGNEITQTSPTGHSTSGAVVSGGNTTTFGFDQNGNQVSQILPDGEMQTWAFDIYGNSIAHKVYSATNHTTALQTTLDIYDTSAANDGRLVEEDRYASNVNPGTTATPNERSTYIYDDNTILPSSEQTDQGNLAEVDDYTLQSGSLVLSTYTHYAYDLLTGSESSITTPEGTIHYVYDEATGELIETWTGTSHSAGQNDILYGYDDKGNLESVTQVVLNGSTPPAVSGGTRYDADGNAIATTSPTTLYTYDGAGNLLSVSDPNGMRTAYSYNDLNELTNEIVTDTNTNQPIFAEQTDWYDDGQKQDVVDTHYNADGSVFSQLEYTWTYDADDRLTSETVTAPGAAPSTSLGLATTVTLPADYNVDGGTAVTLAWDGNNAYLSSGLTEAQVANGTNAGEALFDPSAAVAYGGNGSDWVLVVYDQQNYDAQSFTYASGTLTPDDVVTENRDFGSLPTISLPPVASGFDYEDTNTYDLDDNRTQSVHVGPMGGANESITYKYNGDDQLVSQTSSLSGTTTSTYDADGNLASQTTGTGSSASITTYGYDLRNRMTSATAGGQTTTYTYDDDGVLISETAAGATTYYLNDPNNPTGYSKPIQQSSTVGGSPTLSYVMGLSVEAQSDATNGTLYLLVDGHGSTRALTTSTGVIAAGQVFDYSAFGTAIDFTASTAKTVWQFGGDGRTDSASGLTYQNARWRDDDAFTSFDTSSGNNENPLTLGRYLFGNGDPIDNTDPTGHDALSDQAFELAGLVQSEATDVLPGLMSASAAGLGAVSQASSLDMGLLSAATFGSGSAYDGVVSTIENGINATANWLDASPTSVFQGAVQGAWAGLLNVSDKLTGGMISPLHDYRDQYWQTTGMAGSSTETGSNVAAWVGIAAFSIADGIGAIEDLSGACTNGCFLASTPVLMGDRADEAISQIQVGDRVATDGGAANSVNGTTVAANPNSTHVDPKTWRLITLEIDDGQGGIDNEIEIQALEPMSVLRRMHAKIGGLVVVPFDLAEMGVPDMPAIVISIGQCPNISAGKGRVVLATISHLNTNVFNLTLTDTQGASDTLGVAGYHRIYTEDRGWVDADELRNSELVRSATGDLTVSGLLQTPGAYRVYNIDVEADHDYYVGDLSALVHNFCGSSQWHHIEPNYLTDGANSGDLIQLPTALHREVHDLLDINLRAALPGCPRDMYEGTAAWTRYFNRPGNAALRQKALAIAQQTVWQVLLKHP